MTIPRATSARRGVVTARAKLCLAGPSATFALDAGSPRVMRTPRYGAVTDRRVRRRLSEIADAIERARAEARRKQPEPADTAATAAYRSVIVGDGAVPEECVEELGNGACRTADPPHRSTGPGLGRRPAPRPGRQVSKSTVSASDTGNDWHVST
jgi:hypothetical protein